ncbi:hypothetical protein [Roseivirga sp. UBA1976]|uniref:hypothetical protein n=1 Tax=Roseivirga sp. UBA1976 TaxID=1947386 RepID=UPI0025810A89|nr:hypothetical protein [Roseivirga sp. UBA1976]MEC7753495.1 hypothetical protein [Bacteroidota bacterium]|tara:strand:- start:7687 stop:8691 length:1005 start_codon:yes stop_codon:yes gene_type:complete
MKKKICLALLVSVFTSLSLFSQTVEDVNIKKLGPANLNYRKEAKRIMIADFQVNYQTALTLEDEKKGGKMWRGGIKGDAKASITVVLDGLNPDNLQTLTDQLYAEYVADLKSQGFEIAPIEELWNNKAYEKNREERWELKAGNGPEQGKEFGVILTRPSTQKFVVARRTVDKENGGPLSGLADYEQGTENKVINQKTGYIFNKVVLDVIVFENSQSELSRTLNRHAGSAQVKAETTFKISESSTNRFGMGTFFSKGGVEVADVMERQKFEAGQNADTDRLGTDMGVLRVWRVEDREKANFATVKCDPALYLKGAELGVGAFLKGTVQAMADKAN